MPLLNVCAVNGARKIIQVAVIFIRQERQVDNTLAIQYCHGLNAMRQSNNWFVLQRGLDKERREAIAQKRDFNSRVA
jgi:hypothetical protein